MNTIIDAFYQTKEAWTELVIYTCFFIVLLSYVEYKTNQDIKNYDW